MKKYTRNQMEKALKKVSDFKEEGVVLSEALKKANMPAWKYRYFKSKTREDRPSVVIHSSPKRSYVRKTTAQPTFQPAPQPTSNKCFVIVTDTQSLASVLRGLVL